MKPYVLDIRQADRTMLSSVGGKGANLGELTQMKELQVPEGFCITVDAYRESIRNVPEFLEWIEVLDGIGVQESGRITDVCGQIRAAIEQGGMAAGIENAIADALSSYDKEQAFAVRSSATAEDLPGASFAGQQDTYLNITGKEEVLKHVVKCWASLFTDRAAAYRIQNGFDHRKVLQAVVVQKMIPAEFSGVLFTADPVTSDRKTMSVDAVQGLGEALVSGLVTPDTYKIRNGGIVSKRAGMQALEDEQLLQLAGIGKKIEAHFGSPQDIEWCFAEGSFFIVQSRPITTLFPTPESPDDLKRVYMSVAHMQVMTDPILPLGISFFQLASLFPVDRAGGRVYADITFDLTTPQGRRMVKQKVDNMDPLMADAVRKVMEDTAYIKSLPKGKGNLTKGARLGPWLREAYKIYRRNDPAVLDRMILNNEISLRKLERKLETLSGEEVFEAIDADQSELQSKLFDATIFGAVLACQYASGWIKKNTGEWLTETNVVDTLSKSVAHNITSEMGLALCDVADVAREFPEVCDYLTRAKDEDFFEELEMLQGGAETTAVLKDFLQKYGMRCPGEIDITKPRFAEKPTQLVPVILSDVKQLKPGEHLERFSQGKVAAQEMEEEILAGLGSRSGGRQKAKKAQKVISVFRNFVGAREYAKYFWVRRFAVYKQAILKEAEKLRSGGTIDSVCDVYYLSLDEFREAIRTGRVDLTLISNRKQEYIRYAKLTPPRIILSDGEVPGGEYQRGSAPSGALVGVPVSQGTIEGRARVVSRIEDAVLEKGDILVTSFTDPSWTPVFVTIAGLVTEVGGEMSHGAVITREYGLPAVVGVENATKLIRDGQRIRLNGTEGYVEVLE